MAAFVIVKCWLWYRKKNTKKELRAVVFSQGTAEIVSKVDVTDSGLLKATEKTDRTDELRIVIPERSFSSPRSNLD